MTCLFIKGFLQPACMRKDVDSMCLFCVAVSRLEGICKFFFQPASSQWHIPQEEYVKAHVHNPTGGAFSSQWEVSCIGANRITTLLAVFSLSVHAPSFHPDLPSRF